MRVVYNWLKEYIDFPYSPEELDHILTMSGLEVDELEYLGEGIEDIVIGEIKKISPHPNADKLVICELDTADEILKIVTGAPNVAEGAKVPVAKVGVTLPNGMKIKKAKLRGEPSLGMLCSTDELGLSEERASGIMILNSDAKVGMKLIDYLNLDDYVLKLDLTPNYARCLGYLGIARELEALQNDMEVKYPKIELKEKNDNINDLIEVDVQANDLCPRYTGRIIKDVKIAPSPMWMQKRLSAAGIRPINNVVDITNYVLLEYNQPLHAFDYDQVSDKKIIVRRAKKGEKLVTLDDKERKLDEEVLVIADAEKAIGLAGVMGGANSEVTENTKTIFLESAYFHPVNIRKTAKKLGLPSEASHRFERGLDMENTLEAANRAAYLLQEYADGTVLNAVIDIYPNGYIPLEINLDLEYVNRVLGLELSLKTVKEMLEKLKFAVKENNGESLLVSVPAFRGDVEREADLVEELARMYGYNNIPLTKPISKQQGGKNEKQRFEDLSKEIMLSSGLDEIISFSMTGEDAYKILKLEDDSKLKDWVKIKNPLNETYALMRTSLIPGILEVLSKNAKRQVANMKVFELSNVYFNKEDEEGYCQELKLAAASMGIQEDNWNLSAPDFFYLKGIIENYFDSIGVKNYRFEASEISYLHPGRTAKIMINNMEIGFIGEIHPEIIEELDLKERAAIYQIDIKKIFDNASLLNKYQELPKYPAIERDLAVLVGKDINSAALLELIKKNGGKLLKQVDIFDLYQGDQVPDNQKSLAYKLLFQAENKTLTDEEVNKVFKKIIGELEECFSAKIRGN
ncbi:phenylalanine--tRNA ligase subunit beta [Natronospora cellulosivora (SeqCode)]